MELTSLNDIDNAAKAFVKAMAALSMSLSDVILISIVPYVIYTT